MASEVVANITKNASESVLNNTITNVGADEGFFLSYVALFFMALAPIYVGAMKSTDVQKKQKESGEEVETMTTRDAAMFPIIASCALFGIFIIFRVFSKEYVNLLLTVYFLVLGILALYHCLRNIFKEMIPSAFPNGNYRVHLTEKLNDNKEADVVKYDFDRKDIVCLTFCVLIGVWYIFQKHWIANNMFGLCFSINAIEFLQLNKVVTGCILLSGLFIYDIFWVFGTNVMVTVAKSFEAPIKLVFPRDLLTNGLAANNFAMLGLGDIVIPGIFIALLLRYDLSLNKNGKKLYFIACFIAYALGLLTTIVVMHVFKHAQPALLYLVPACLGIPLFLALIRGDLKSMFEYADNPAKEEEKENKNK